jgi:hypothetical protein
VDEEDIDDRLDAETIRALHRSLDPTSQLTTADKRALRGRRRHDSEAGLGVVDTAPASITSETELRNHKYPLLLVAWKVMREGMGKSSKPSSAVQNDLHDQARQWAAAVLAERRSRSAQNSASSSS